MNSILLKIDNLYNSKTNLNISHKYSEYNAIFGDEITIKINNFLNSNVIGDIYLKVVIPKTYKDPKKDINDEISEDYLTFSKFINETTTYFNTGKYNDEYDYIYKKYSRYPTIFEIKENGYDLNIDLVYEEYKKIDNLLRNKIKKNDEIDYSIIFKNMIKSISLKFNSTSISKLSGYHNYLLTVNNIDCETEKYLKNMINDNILYIPIKLNLNKFLLGFMFHRLESNLNLTIKTNEIDNLNNFKCELITNQNVIKKIDLNKIIENNYSISIPTYEKQEFDLTYIDNDIEFNLFEPLIEMMFYIEDYCEICDMEIILLNSDNNLKKIKHNINLDYFKYYNNDKMLNNIYIIKFPNGFDINKGVSETSNKTDFMLTHFNFMKIKFKSNDCLDKKIYFFLTYRSNFTISQHNIIKNR